jgi:Tol biopolymer transport system component
VAQNQSPPVPLTSGPLGLESPQPSLDGKKIFAVGSQGRSELVRYDAKSAQFVPSLNGISAALVSFSRDGQWIAYVTWPEGDRWRCRIDGSDKLQLAVAPMVVDSADWSPDGSQIAFSAFAPGQKERVFVVSASAGESRQLAEGALNMRSGGWSPDGNSLFLFTQEKADAFSFRFVDLKTMKTTSIHASEAQLGATLSLDGRYLSWAPCHCVYPGSREQAAGCPYSCGSISSTAKIPPRLGTKKKPDI